VIRVCLYGWSSTLKSGIFVLLLSQHELDNRTEIFKKEFLRCDQNDAPVQADEII